MPIFIKTEQFTSETLSLLPEQRSKYIKEHLRWASKLKNAGKSLSSGYLINELGQTGGGGFLVLEANNFDEAKVIVMDDPMIKNNLVTWKLHQWIPVLGGLLNQRG